MSDIIPEYEEGDAEFEDFSQAAHFVRLELDQRLTEGNPQPRLAPVRRVVELLGDVHRAYPVIQIAGTNGKTSTSRMTEAILRSYGLRTGLFTSPHLVNLNERIVIDGEPVSDDAFVTNWLDVKPYIELVDNELVEKGDVPLSFFEVLTILAFATFADAPVDVAVIEVGLGGEWDATNVADATVAVFCPVGLDHVDRLGSTLAEIARTKSGIIKPASLIISAEQAPEVVEVLNEAAALTESQISYVGNSFDSAIQVLDALQAVGGQVISVRGQAGEYRDVFLGLYGDYQAENAALAIGAVEAFLGGGEHPLSEEVVQEAFANVTSPGRMQVVSPDPVVLIDAAHNPHGAEALSRAVTENFAFDDLTVVLAVFADKDATGIVQALAPIVSRLIVTTAPNERARDADDLAAIAGAVLGEEVVSVEADPSTAIQWATEEAAERGGAVLITGSISLLGLALSHFKKSPGDKAPKWDAS